MRPFNGIRSLQEDDGGGDGGGGGGAPGAVPYLNSSTPNVTIHGPSSSGGRSTPIATKGYREGIDREQASFVEQEKAISAQLELDQKIAAQKMAQVPQQAEADQAYLQHRQQLQAEHDARIARARAQHDQLFQRAVDSADQGDYWHDKTAEQKTMARIAVWLGAFGNGPDNKAVSYIDDQIKQDAAMKAAKAERFYKLADMSKGALSDAYRQRAEELSNEDLNYAAGLKVAANYAERFAQTMLPQQQQIAAQAKIAKLHQDAGKALQTSEEKLNATATSHSESGSTTTQLPIAAGAKPVLDKNGQPIGYAPGEQAKKVQAELDAQQKLDDAMAHESEVQAKHRGSIGGKLAIGLSELGLHTEAGEEIGAAHAQTRAAVPAALGIPPRMSQEQKNLVEEFAPGGGVFHSPVEQIQRSREAIKARGDRTIKMGGVQRVPQVRVDSVPDLIARGRALQKAGDLAGAKRIHDQVKSMVGE